MVQTRYVIVGLLIALIVVAGVVVSITQMTQMRPSPTMRTTMTAAATTAMTATMPAAKPQTDTKTLVIAMDISDAVSLDPARAYEFTSTFVANQLYDKLVDFELPDLVNVKPEVAESWEVKDNGKVWIFHIRHGINFANGDPLTADAVVYSLRRVIILKQTASWVLTQFVSSPNQIEKIDDYTVRITLDKPVAPSFFLATLTFTTSAIVNPKVVEAHAKGGDMGSEWLTDHSAGSGPYVLEKWDREGEIVLVANDNYWKGPPKIKRIVLRHVPEPTDQLLLLKKGDVDIATGLTPDQIESLKGTPGINIVSTPRLQIAYIGMNVGVGPLSKEEVREAIRYAIDYDGILKILKGSAIKWQTIIPKGLLGANPAAPYYRDVNKARELLQRAGYPNGFEIELATPPTWPNIDIATKIQSDLAEVGIRVKIVQMAAAEMYEKYRKQGLQLVLAGWGSDYPDPDNNAKAFGNYRVRQLAWRNMWYDNYTADMVEKAALETDQSKREQMYIAITEYILRHGPYAVLYQEVAQHAVRDWVKNYIPDPTFFLLDLSKVYKEIS